MILSPLQEYSLAIGMGQNFVINESFGEPPYANKNRRIKTSAVWQSAHPVRIRMTGP